MLCAATGYDAVSLQPNAGSQGEYAGLLVIRAYHASARRGASQRLPDPGVGARHQSRRRRRWPACSVVVVACDDDGNVDLADLEAQGARRTRATSPRSWSRIRRRTACSRRASRASARSCTRTAARCTSTARTSTRWSASPRPGHFGADVSHLNLHKTFCIPHGGGGPGVGPVAVQGASRAVPAGPSLHAVARDGRGRAGRRSAPCRAAPFGSASILPISWMYIDDDGRRGPRARRPRARSSPRTTSRSASRRTIPVLYQRPGRARRARVHPRPAPAEGDVRHRGRGRREAPDRLRLPRADDELPGAGTLMVEPTESEIEARARPLRRRDDRDPRRDPRDRGRRRSTAPTIRSSTRRTRRRGRRRRRVDARLSARASRPIRASRSEASKYWPPVARVDNVYGDRNLFCSCIPVRTPTTTARRRRPPACACSCSAAA